jgi:hypothetical protein
MCVVSLVLGVACAAGLLSGLMRVMRPRTMMVFPVLAVAPGARAGRSRHHAEHS